MKLLRWVPIVFLVFLILGSFSLVSIFLQAGLSDSPKTVEIQKGMNGKEISRVLLENEIIKREIDFRIASKLLMAEDQIKAGKYEFGSHPILFDVLLKLKSGKSVGQEAIKVTFPEGTSIYKMGTILQEHDIACYGDFRNLPKYEGYLYADTYIMNRDITAEALANIMLKRFNEIVMPYWEKNKKATSFNLHEILTLASIIEKEAILDSERPLISSVFHNRLKINMPLAADPTVKYVLEQPSKRVYYKQLKVNSSYNTYKNRGLPPGPICSPSLKSIEAAIYPKDTNFLYFVARKNGSHIFSKSFEEHKKARLLIP